MQHHNEDSAPGLIGWLIILSVGLFLGTKALWFNELHPGDKALFWINLAVAVGTLALAVVTYIQVRETKAVLMGEDRRHQQTFAPLVELYGPGYGEPDSFQIRNIGNGIALNVSIDVQGTLTSDTSVQTEATQEDLDKEFAAEGQVATTQCDGKTFLITKVRKTQPFVANYFISGLKNETKASNLPFQPFADAGYWNPAVSYDRIQVTYSDMFGNDHATEYSTDSLQYYAWKQPRHLAISTNKKARN